MQDSSTTIQQLKATVDAFVEERDWRPRQSLRKLASSICIEAAELLEHFQWHDDASDPEEMPYELADILIYCLEYANYAQLDIAELVEEKLARSSKKYPVSVFNDHTVDREEYLKAKKAYREERGRLKAKQPLPDTLLPQ